MTLWRSGTYVITGGEKRPGAKITIAKDRMVVLTLRGVTADRLILQSNVNLRLDLKEISALQTLEMRQGSVLTLTSGGAMTIAEVARPADTSTEANTKVFITGGSLDNLNATANNGKVEVNNLLTQTFAASTRNGRISLANTSALSITAQAQNGDVKLDHTASPYFYCTATNASVVGTVTGRGAEYGLNLTADSGRVTLTDANDDSFAIRSSAPVQQNLGAAQSFTANASNGNVNLEFVQ